MRCIMLVTSLSEPSAVCAIEMPSLALRIAWLMPRTCEVIEVEMARPAASSLALLMRLPVDRRSIAVPSALPATDEAFAALMALILVLITDMINSPEQSRISEPDRTVRCSCHPEERQPFEKFKCCDDFCEISALVCQRHSKPKT